MSNIASQPIELRKQRDFSECISTGFQFVRQNWKGLYRPLIFICMPMHIVAALLMGSFFRTISPGHLPTGGMFGAMSVGYIIMGISFLFLYLIVFEYMRLYMENSGLPPAIATVWSRVKQQFFAYFAIGLLITIITIFGCFLFLLPGIFLMVTFSASFPLRAFERTSVGDSIGNAFSTVWGNWWWTFLIIFVMGLLLYLMYLVVLLPFLLIAGVGLFSGFVSHDPTDLGSNISLLMSIYMILAGLAAVLFMPVFIVTISVHILSLMEGKKATGLMQQVENMDLGNRTSPATGNVQ